MSSLNEFINRAAVIMANDRPDLWSVQEAEQMLDGWAVDMIDSLANSEEPTVSIGTGGFQLSYHVTDGLIEWELTRHVLDFVQESNGTDTDIFDWTESSKLFNS